MEVKTLGKRIWRFVYNSSRKFVQRITPEAIRQIKIKVMYWRDKKTIIKNQETLQKILAEQQENQDCRKVIIFLPSLDWNVQLFQRPQQLALALSKIGAIVFYIQPKPDQNRPPFILFNDRLYICPVHLATFQNLTNPFLYLLTWNSRYASHFHHPRILYDYVDDIHAFYGDHRRMQTAHQNLLHNANYILATAQKLYDEVRSIRPDVIFSPNGVVYEHFVCAARREFSTPPQDMLAILSHAKPVIGYYGALARWFDFNLVKQMAILRPDYQYVLIGPDYDGTLEFSGLLREKNIYWLGVKSYEELPQYLQYFDVAMIPFVVNEITHATSPLKLFEYMAAEKPVVITPMKESMRYPGVLIGKNSMEFAQQLDNALALKEDQTYLSLLRQTALENTWEQRAEEIISAIETSI